ncbi:MAG: hypothetical protein AAB917_02405 [Patescibacteria group bacterium]
MKTKSTEKKRNISVFYKIFPRREYSRGDNGKYIANEIDSVSLDLIRSSFVKINLKPTFSIFENEVKKKLRGFGIEFDSGLFKEGETQIEIFHNKNILVIVEKITDFGSRLLQITFCYESEKEYTKLFGRVKKIRNLGSLKEGTYFELAIKEKLDQILNADSPNGKIIKDSKLRKIFSVLNDPIKRQIVRHIAKNLGAGAKIDTRDSIIDGLDLKFHIVAEDALNNPILFSKNYRLMCEKCGWIARDLVFGNKDDISNAINTSRFTCMNRKSGCSSGKAKEVEVFAINPDVVRTLGGVWFEKYVDDILKERVKYTWPGKMNSDDELDNVFVFTDKTFLVECKDTSFGMSDLYSIMVKAKAIEADEIIVVTTQDVHANVTAKINDLNKSGEYQIEIISGSQEYIKRGLFSFLTIRQNEFFKQILTGGRSRRRIRLPVIMKGL